MQDDHNAGTSFSSASESEGERQARSPSKLYSSIATLIKAVTLVLALAHPGTAKAGQTLRTIDLEGSVTIGNSPWTLTDSGVSYTVSTQGGALVKPLRDPNNAAAGVYGLTFQIGPVSSSSSQREEYVLATGTGLFPLARCG